jgi:hypothetical protein
MVWWGMQNCNRRNEESKRKVGNRRKKGEWRARKKAYKIIRNKKKIYIKNVTESIKEDQKHNNTGKFITQ